LVITRAFHEPEERRWRGQPRELPMTPDEEFRFIALWTAGTETAVIAQALSIPRGTVSSRTYAEVMRLRSGRRTRRQSPQ
jgi:hypothetical protein